MSNRPAIQLTKFVDLNPDGSESHVSYGVRIYDDYEQKYDNTIEKSDLPSTPEEALDLIEELAPEMHAYIVDEKRGFYFCDDWISLGDEDENKDE